MRKNYFLRNFPSVALFLFFFFFFFFFLEFLDNIISIKRLITLTGREINASNENMIMKRR